MMFAGGALVARLHGKILVARPACVIVSVNELANIRVVTPLADVFFAFALDDLLDLGVTQALGPELLDPLWKLVDIPIHSNMSRAMSDYELTYVFLKGLGTRLPAGCSVMASA